MKWLRAIVRSSGARDRLARPARANRDARSPASRAGNLSWEWNTSALWRVPGLNGKMNAIPECRLFGAPIEPDDAALLCVHFQPKRSSPLRSAERAHD